MEKIKQWIICIIFCSIIAAIVNILTPDGSVQKTMKTVVASFLLCAFLSPFIDGSKIDLAEDLPEFSLYYSSLALDVSQKMTDDVESLTEIKISELLKEKNIEYDDIRAEAKTDSNNEIYISLITITLDEKYKSHEKEITKDLKTMFSAETDYVWLKK